MSAERDLGPTWYTCGQVRFVLWYYDTDATWIVSIKVPGLRELDHPVLRRFDGVNYIHKWCRQRGYPSPVEIGYVGRPTEVQAS